MKLKNTKKLVSQKESVLVFSEAEATKLSAILKNALEFVYSDQVYSPPLDDLKVDGVVLVCQKKNLQHYFKIEVILNTTERDPDVLLPQGREKDA